MKLIRAARSVVFWIHLFVAIAVGMVIIIMSATGTALAFEKQVLASAAARHRVTPPTIGARLSLDTIAARVAAVSDTATVASITVNDDATLPLTISLSDRRSLFVDPYTASVVGSDAALRGFFQSVERWHRSLALGTGTRSKAGTTITGICNVAFLFLVLSGFYLWWPRRWTPRAFAAVLFFNRGAKGRKRNWNWHHVLGFWAAPALLMIVVTGTFMSYAWPQRLVVRAFGGQVATAGGRGDASGGVDRQQQRRPRGENAGPRASLDSLIAGATPTSPWETIQLRLPQADARTATATVSYGSTSRPDRRVQLTLDASTAAVMPSQGYDTYDPARKLRAWVKPIHTGEAGGIVGETVAALASTAAVVLGFTGFLLAFARFRSRVSARQRVTALTPRKIRADEATTGVA